MHSAHHSQGTSQVMSSSIEVREASGREQIIWGFVDCADDGAFTSVRWDANGG